MPAVDPRPVALRPVVAEDVALLERFWQLYRHDLSEFRGTLPGPDGLFAPGRLPSYLAEDPDRRAYVVLEDAEPVGFAFVRGLQHPPYGVGEFFVARAARRRGVGRAAARALLEQHPGSWEIAFQEENPGAARFWRALAAELVGDAWSEERRAVPGKPDLPPDVWLALEV